MNTGSLMKHDDDEGRIDPCCTLMSGTGSTTGNAIPNSASHPHLKFIWNYARELNVRMHFI